MEETSIVFLAVYIINLHHMNLLPICSSSMKNIIESLLGIALNLQIALDNSAMWETQIRSLGREDPLEKEMATQFSILAWKITWTEEPVE